MEIHVADDGDSSTVTVTETASLRARGPLGGTLDPFATAARAPLALARTPPSPVPSPDAAGAVFAALADATRRDLLTRLSAEGPATATSLAATLPVTRQAVAKHLAVLHEAGLVAPARAGRETRYRLTPEPLADAMSWMATVGADWDRRLAALRTLLS